MFMSAFAMNWTFPYLYSLFDNVAFKAVAKSLCIFVALDINITLVSSWRPGILPACCFIVFENRDCRDVSLNPVYIFLSLVIPADFPVVVVSSRPLPNA